MTRKERNWKKFEEKTAQQTYRPSQVGSVFWDKSMCAKAFKFEMLRPVCVNSPRCVHHLSPINSKEITEDSMASNSTHRPSVQSFDHGTSLSMSGHSARQDSTSRRLEPRGDEQGPHQTTGHAVADSEADPEDERGGSLPEHDLASDATNSTVITPEDLDRICREYDELVNKTYREGICSFAYPKPQAY